MLFYYALIYIFFASAALADSSSKRGESFRRSEEYPILAAGATLVASATSVIARFSVPNITEGLQTTSSAFLGVMFDGVDGCVGALSGVQIMVDAGKSYYHASYRDSRSVSYRGYEGSNVNPGNTVTVGVDASADWTNLTVSFSNGPVPLLETISLDTPLCATYTSWVVEKLPNLPLAKIGTVYLTALAGLGDSFLNIQGATTISNNGTTASLSESWDGEVVSITVN